jgi:ubiquitin carboxyl-terminal hydrolase 14
LRNVPGLTGPSSSAAEAAGAEATKKFVEQYLMGQMRRELSIYLPFVLR